MELTKGGVIVGERFHPRSAEQSFDVLHAQRETPLSVLGEDYEKAHKQNEKIVEKNASTLKEKPKINIEIESETEQSGWKMPEEARHYLEAMIASADPTIQKKLEVLHFNIVDEDDLSVVKGKIDSSDGLTDKQRETLKKYLDGENNLTDISIQDDSKVVQNQVKSSLTVSKEQSIPGIENAESSLTLEKLREDLAKVREPYLRELIQYKTELSQGRTKFRITMTNLGQPARQMPESPKSAEFLKTEQVYNQSWKALIEKLRHDEKVTQGQFLSEVEDEQQIFMKRFEESLPGLEARNMKEGFGLLIKSALPNRFNVGVGFVGTGGRTETIKRRPIDSVVPKRPPVIEEKTDEQIVRPEEVIPEQQVAEQPEMVSEPDLSAAMPTEEKIEPSNLVQFPNTSPILEEKTSEIGTTQTVETPTPSFQEKEPSFLDVISGLAPLPDKFQFDPTKRKERAEYGIKFHQALIMEGGIDYSLAINYDGGQIMVLQSRENLTILLNGKKLGTGKVESGKIDFEYDNTLDKGTFGRESEYKTAFEKAKKMIGQKVEQFMPKLKMAA